MTYTRACYRLVSTHDRRPSGPDHESSTRKRKGGTEYRRYRKGRTGDCGHHTGLGRRDCTVRAPYRALVSSVLEHESSETSSLTTTVPRRPTLRFAGSFVEGTLPSSRPLGTPQGPPDTRRPSGPGDETSWKKRGTRHHRTHPDRAERGLGSNTEVSPRGEDLPLS